jgi:hypothetical protein
MRCLPSDAKQLLLCHALRRRLTPNKFYGGEATDFDFDECVTL